MNIKRKLIAGCVVALAVATTSIIAYAASAYGTPAEAVAGITGRTTESVTAEKAESGKTYGTIAAEAGKLDEFKKETLEMKKDHLNAQVAAGTITQEKADEIIKAIEENQEVCDGTGSAKIGQSSGARFGSNGSGCGLGGANRGTGMGRGQGAGCGMSNGACAKQKNYNLTIKKGGGLPPFFKSAPSDVSLLMQSRYA